MATHFVGISEMAYPTGQAKGLPVGWSNETGC
jgi:hypothetical protein